MATTAKTDVKTGGDRLPPVTVGKIDRLLQQVEALYDQQRDAALGKMREHLDSSREATRRPITAQEAVSYSAMMRDLVGDQAATPTELQDSGLWAQTDPSPTEMLVVGAVSAGPALLHAALRFVATVEMAADRFQQADDDGSLDDLLDSDVLAMRTLSMREVRERAARAFTHWAVEVGAGRGEALGRLAGTVWTAIEQAAAQITLQTRLPDPSSSTDSPDTTDGPGTAS